MATQQSGLFAPNVNDSLTLLSAIDVTQFGQTLDGNATTYVWTGSFADGTSASSGHWLGGTTNQPKVGLQGATNTSYLFYAQDDISTLLPVYAISGELTVPGGTSVPEPGTAPVLATGLALLAGLGWRRHASKSV